MLKSSEDKEPAFFAIMPSELYVEAEQVFALAASLGPPYYGHRLFSAAQLNEQIDHPTRALHLCETLIECDPTSASVSVAGTRLARKLAALARQRVEAALANLPPLSDQHAKYLRDAA